MTNIYEFRSKKPDYEVVEYEADETIELHDTTIVQHGEMTSDFRKKLQEAYDAAIRK